MAIRAATLVCLLVSAASAAACPFCGVVARPLAERRDAAAAVAIGQSETERLSLKLAKGGSSLLALEAHELS